MRKIEVFIKTPFGSYIGTTGEYDDECQFLYLNDDNDMNGKKVAVNLSVAINHDLEKIRRDVEEHKKMNDKTDYSGYDVNDIRLEKVTIKGNFVVCGYTINAGDYRRLCVGVASEPFRDIATNSKYYLLCSFPYSGQVCW